MNRHHTTHTTGQRNTFTSHTRAHTSLLMVFTHESGLVRHHVDLSHAEAQCPFSPLRLSVGELCVIADQDTSCCIQMSE